MLDEIRALYDIEPAGDEFLPQDLLKNLASITGRINREIAVYINRKGNITDISIGDNETVTLSEVQGRRGRIRLSGIRCIHTHPNGDGRLSPVDINSMLKLNLDAMTAVGVKDGEAREVYTAVPALSETGERDKADIFGPFGIESNESDFIFEIINQRDQITSAIINTERNREERAILVGLEKSSGKIINGKSEGERSLDELEELSITAGLKVLEKVLQRKSAADSALYAGRGKIEQLGLMCQALDINTLVFDDELSGAQTRNIEALTGVKVIDRTTLILDIFAQRARSSEGKLQVELAQLKYRLPRLMGLGGQLSRLGGGIGTRGPGEKKLETDRRHIRRRISALNSELQHINKRRCLVRESRRQNSTPVIALIGYTNSGKSTLMNKLCKTDVLAEDKLFATLDPTTRKLELPDGKSVLLVDTVGFIRKLPHELVEAFKSTLEEAVYADMLLHIVDASDEEADEHISVSEGILRSLGAFDKPVLLVLNKLDLVAAKLKGASYPESYTESYTELRIESHTESYTEPYTESHTAASYTRLPISASSSSDIIEISAKTGQGLGELLERISNAIPSEEVEINVFAPYSQGWVVPYVHENGQVAAEEYAENGVKIKAKISKGKIENIKEFVE